MTNQLKSLAMLEVAEAILKDHQEPMSIQTLIQKVAEIKDVDPEDIDRITQLYMDITQSAKFVYCGDDQWDLKERNLELWDKDGYAFVQAEEIEEDTEEDLDFTEYQLDESDLEEEVEEADDDEVEDKVVEAEEDEEIKEESAYIEVELPIKSTDDDDDDDELDIEFDDEDDYNEIMDDYEDMYEDD
jgi:DNA-directed RNA polymerase subunit delta